MSLRIWNQKSQVLLAKTMLMVATFSSLVLYDPSSALADVTTPTMYSSALSSSIVLQSDHADVTGDDIPDSIQLVGKPSEFTSGQFSKLSIEVKDGAESKQTYFYVEQGYTPLLQLCDLDGDHVNDLYLTVYDPFDGGFPIHSIYTLSSSKTPGFNQPLPNPLTVQGKLMDNYKIQLELRNTYQTVTLDMKARQTAYDQAGFYQNGRLLQPKPVTVDNSFSELLPIDIDKDGTSELKGIQRISGITPEDTIAYAVSVWKWRYDQWTLLSAELVLPSQLKPAQPKPGPAVLF